MDEKELIEYFKNIRKDFPILKQKINGHNLVYVDNGASTQKPQIMIDTISDFYTNYYSNVHRGLHSLSEMASEKYEGVRVKVAKLINANKNEVVFTKGATDSLNKIVYGFEHLIKKDDEIILSQHEHHANLVPWQELAKRTGAVLKFIKIKEDLRLDVQNLHQIISEKTKIVSITHISNVLGVENDITKISQIIKNKAKNDIIFIVDGAQSVPHKKIDVKTLGCDILTFSAHKMCGPTGVGILWGKMSTLEEMKPSEFGGDMIDEVEFGKSTYNKVPFKFEAGTPNIAGVIGFGASVDYLMKIGMENIEKYEHLLTLHFLKKVEEVDDLILYGPISLNMRSSLFSFNIKGIHAHDMSTILDKFGIAIRGGNHCAMPLVNLLGTCSTSRISLYFYNTFEEIDYIIEILKKAKALLESGDIF